jgi:hypothetical protein
MAATLFHMIACSWVPQAPQEWKQLERKQRLNQLVRPKTRHSSPTRLPLPRHLHSQAASHAYRKIASGTCKKKGRTEKRKRERTGEKEQPAKHESNPLPPSPLLNFHTAASNSVCRLDGGDKCACKPLRRRGSPILSVDSIAAAVRFYSL